MRIVLTGAGGFVGRCLRTLLEAQCHQVTPVGRSQWNLDGSPFPTALLESAAAVIHLAGEPVAQRWTAAAKARINSTRSAGTAALAEAINRAKTPPRVLVSASAVGYYGDRGDELLTEASAPGTDFLADVCQAWESAASRACDSGCRVVTVRIGLALGANGGALTRMLPLFRMGLGGRLGNGRQWMSWIHLDDLAAIFARALSDDTLSGPVNGTAPQPVPNEEFTRALGRALHRPALLPAPAFALRLALGEMSQVLLASERAVPHRLACTSFEFRYPELSAALAQIFAPAGMLK